MNYYFLKSCICFYSTSVCSLEHAMKHFQVLWFTYEKKLPTTHPINGLPYMPMQSLQIQKLLAYNAKKKTKKNLPFSTPYVTREGFLSLSSSWQ